MNTLRETIAIVFAESEAEAHLLMSGYHDGGVISVDDETDMRILNHHMPFDDYSLVRPLSVKSRQETEAILKLRNGDDVDMKVWIDECSHIDTDSFRRMSEYLDEPIPLKILTARRDTPKLSKSERRKILKKGGSW